MPKINRIDHICIAVKDLEQAQTAWAPLLGKAEPDETYVDELEKIKVARYILGGVGFELMESTSPDGDVARFIERHGEGIMLVSFNVDSTRGTIDELEAQGYPFIGGARPFREGEFAFVHPRATNGVLLEYIDDAGGA
jgi:methylmalonyl-CoA/ethylmalonyl-CoA epimerase